MHQLILNVHKWVLLDYWELWVQLMVQSHQVVSCPAYHMRATKPWPTLHATSLLSLFLSRVQTRKPRNLPSVSLPFAVCTFYSWLEQLLNFSLRLLQPLGCNLQILLLLARIRLAVHGWAGQEKTEKNISAVNNFLAQALQICDFCLNPCSYLYNNLE